MAIPMPARFPMSARFTSFMVRFCLAALLPLAIALPALAFGVGRRPAARPAVPLVAQPASAADVTVTIRDAGFRPDPAEARRGQTVRWVNRDDRDYSLQGRLPGMRSGTLKPGGSWTYRVPADAPAGGHPYACKLRPRAKGTLKVTE